MEGKDEGHDHSFEDFKPQKVHKKFKHEKKIDPKRNSRSSSTEDSPCNGIIVEESATTVCVVCKSNVERDGMENHLSSCLEKYKHFKEKEADKESAAGRRKEQFICCLCNQILASLSYQQREEHVNKCLNKQEAKRKWKDLGLNENRKKLRTSSIMDCPICGQSFISSEARHSHLKNCGTKHNMNTKQLIEAVRLQEKHAKERKDAGLPPVTSSSSKAVLRKSTRQKPCKPQQPKDKNEEDLQTALALSASLSESVNNRTDKELDTELSDDINLQFANSTEDYHVLRFHSVREQRAVKRKTKSKQTPTLLLRKEEERAKLLEERVSSLLGASMPACCTNFNDNVTTKKRVQGRTISDRFVNDRSLWTVSCRKDIAQDDFYVLPLRDLVSPSKVQAGSKLRRLSQLPGSSLTQKLPICTSLQYNETGKRSEMSTQERIDFILEDDDDSIICKNGSTKTEIGGFCFQKELSTLPYEQNHQLNSNIKSSLKLAQTFRSLVGNEDHSDISVITDDGEKCISAHSVILSVRCPDIMKDIKPSCHKDVKYFIDWKEIHSDAAIAFLEVIYSGNTFSPLNNEDDIKKLIYRYNAQPLFQDLEIFLEMKSKHSKFEKSEKKELIDMLSGIWENSDGKEVFVNNTTSTLETEDDSDTDDLDKVYAYLSQKQYKGEKCRSNEADRDEEMDSCDLSDNNYSRDDDPFCVSQEKTIDDKSKLCSELSPISRGIDSNNTSCELTVTPKKLGTKMARYNVKNICSIETFDGESDIEMKLSKSINKLQSIDLKEENLTQAKTSSSFSSLEHSPYHFSEDENYHHEKYSSPTKSFGRKKHQEFASQWRVSSTTNPPSQKDQTNFRQSSKQSLSVQQVRSFTKVSSTKTDICIKNEYSPQKSQEKEVRSSNNSPVDRSKDTTNSISSYSSTNQVKASHARVKIPPPLKPSPIKCKEIWNNSPKNETFEENDFNYDTWEDFPDRDYDEFIADLNDSSFDNEDVESQLVTKNMSSPPEVATYSFFNEAKTDYEFPTPSPHKGKKKKDPSLWKENGVKNGSSVKSNVKNCKNAKAKNDVTPIPNYKEMITPELKEHCAKYGVKKLPRKKAVAVLTHIYEEIHPFVTDSEYDTSITSTPVNRHPSSIRESDLKSSDKKREHCKQEKNKPKRQLKQLSQKQPVRTNLSQKMSKHTESKKSNNKCTQPNSSNETSSKDLVTREEDTGNSLNDADVDELPSSQTSSQSETSDMLEESFIAETESRSSDDIHKRLHSYIQQDAELYEKILRYEPVDFIEFHKRIRASGFKLSTAGLMDFFDEECIIFSMPRDAKTKAKQKKRTQIYQKRRAAAIAKQDR